jgi:hypothetical protein
MGASSKALQKMYIYLKGKDATIQNFKLEILIYFNPFITKH